MSELAQALLATLAVSLVSLVGLLLVGRLWTERMEVRVISFAAGVLLATTFLDLLPEGIELSARDPHDLLLATLAAMVGFYFLERLIHGFHSHTDAEGHHHHQAPHSVASRYFILIGDGLHNMIDGVAIGVSFLVSTELGLVTTLAVLAHEIPHEVGDYGILVRGGYSRRRAVFLNFLSGLTAVVGAAAVFVFGDAAEANLDILLAATAGMFLYIAAANLIPELHHQQLTGRLLYGAPFLLGIVLIWTVLQLVPHAHEEDETPDHEETAHYITDCQRA